MSNAVRIFGNFEEEAPEEVIKKILKGLVQEADGELNAARYIQQLRGLIQLRKLTNEFEIAMGTITKFKVEKDPFYQKGIKRGRNEVARELKKEGLALDFIAKTTKLSIEEVAAL